MSNPSSLVLVKKKDRSYRCCVYYRRLNTVTRKVSTSLGNSGLCWTVFARNRDTAVPAKNGDYQTLICVLVARPRRCLTLSNPVPWQNWMAAYLGYTLRMRMLFRGWHVNDTHTRRRRLVRTCVDSEICHIRRSCRVWTWNCNGSKENKSCGRMACVKNNSRGSRIFGTGWILSTLCTAVCIYCQST